MSNQPPKIRPAHADLLACLCLLAVVFAAQFAHDRIVGSDGFFHIRAAERVLRGDMPWMPLSVWKDGWVDHQLLFHLALFPLTLVLPPILAAKVGAAALGACGLGALYLLLRRQRAPLPLLFALLPVALSWHFLVRLEMPRAQGLSLGLMLACTLALLEGRHRLLFALCWLYAWTYQVALLALPIALLHALVVALRREPSWSWRGALAGPAAASLGLTAGFVIHPHSPGTLRFLWQHVVLKVLNRSALPVGSEWEVAGPSALLALSGGTLLAFAAALLLARRARLQRSATFALALAASALGAALISAKFLEYATPLACLALALVLRDRLPRAPSPLAGRIASVGLALALLLSGSLATQAIRRSEPDPYRLAGVMQWARTHIPAGERIYHFSWNDFPELVAHGPRWEYIVGLDPHFLQLADPDLWTLYDRIGAGWGRNPSKPIADRFGARWALLVLPYPGDPRGLLDADPGLHPVYEDAHAVLYEVRGGP